MVHLVLKFCLVDLQEEGISEYAEKSPTKHL